MHAVIRHYSDSASDLDHGRTEFADKAIDDLSAFIDDKNFLVHLRFLDPLFGGAIEADSLLMRMLFVLVSIVALALALFVLNLIYRAVMRLRCTAEIGIKLPRSFKVRRASSKLNELRLGRGAHWQFAKKDGTRDKRRASNKILYTNSTIIYKGFRITGPNPLDIYRYALQMRSKGHNVSMARAEQNKYERAQHQHTQRSDFVSTNAIYEAYKDDPYSFESFVGSIYSRFGYSVQETARSNDGGIDLKMSKGNTLTVVECKCYAPNTSVGRPIVQKLVGSAMAFNASGKIVVTTASFSTGAIEYATNMGVDLVDGTALIGLARQSGVSAPNSFLPNATSPWELTESELLQQIPDDLKHHVYKTRKIKQPV